MAELNTVEIMLRLVHASGDGKWEKKLHSVHMDGRDDWHFYAEGEPSIKVVATCRLSDAVFIEHAKEDIIDLLNRVSELEAELLDKRYEIERLEEEVNGLENEIGELQERYED